MPRSSRAPVSLQAVKSIAQVVPAVADRLVYSIRLADIEPSDHNPRHHMDGIDELADSLRAHGLLQPIVVRRRDGGYVLIAGHRRYEAARKLGWSEIAAVVREETDDQAYILTLVENLQREDLTPKEEASALEVLVRERGWTTRQVGEAIKRSHVCISKRLRVFEDQVLAKPVLDNHLAVSTAEELLRVPDKERATFVRQAIDERWGQSEARQAVQDWKVTFQPAKPAPRLEERFRALSADLHSLGASQLSRSARREGKRLLAVLRQLVDQG